MTEPKSQYNSNKNLILALDASTTAVGFCFADGDKYICSGVYKPCGKDVWNRIYRIGQWLSSNLYRYPPHIIAIEEPCGDSGNRRTDRLLGAVLGVCIYIVKLHSDATVALINPQSVKTTGFHKGALWETALLIGKEKISGDEADAVGVWQAYLVAEKYKAATGRGGSG